MGTAGSSTGLKPGRNQMLPAVKPGIDGPLAGPDQRQRHSQHPQRGGMTHMGRRRERDPRLGARRHSSGERRPQTGDQEEACQRSDHVRRRNRITGSRDDAVQQSGAGQQPLNQEPGASPAVREVREQSLHRYPVFSLRNWQLL